MIFKGVLKIQIKFNDEVSEAQIREDIKDFDLNPSVTFAGNLRNEVIIKTTKQLDLAQGVKCMTFGTKAWS